MLGATAFWIASLLVTLARAQCPAITTQVTYSATTATVSAATSAIITQATYSGQRIVVQSCGQVSMGELARVTMLGGTATMSGGPSPRGASAFVESGTAVFPSPTRASIFVSASQTVLLSGGSEVYMQLGPTASASLQGQRLQIYALGDNQVTMTADSGYIRVEGANARARVDWTGEYSVYGRSVEAGDSAQVEVDGQAYDAAVNGNAILTASGINVACYAEVGGTCLGRGSSQTFEAGWMGYVEATQGTNNIVQVYESGRAAVGGPGNTGLADPGATLEVYSGATATLSQGSDATIYSSASDVTVYDGATATLYAAATVSAQAGAQLRAISPQTTLTSVGEAPGGFTIFGARELASAPNNNPIKRAQPTGRCATGFETCPGLRGVFRCIDITSDIFNCGGCALAGTGVDCTSQYDGAVACIAGSCVVA